MNNENKYYTGIGSRDTPMPIMYLMDRVATYIGSKGYTLRSGAAAGAASAFEKCAPTTV